VHRVSLVGGAAVLLAALVAGGCRSHARARPAVHDATFGTLDAARPSLADLGDDVAYARALLEGRADAVAPKRAVEARGRRAFVSVFAEGAAPIVTTALGVTLADSIAAASRDARARANAADLAHARIELDVAIARRGATAAPTLDALGDDGFALSCGEGRVGFVLPGELVNRALIADEDDDGEPTLARSRFDALVGARAGEGATACRPLRFRTLAAVESHDHAGVVPLVRGRTPRVDPARLDPGTLARGVRLGGDYLARAVSPEGRFVYLFDAVRGVPTDDDYNVIRHAGATDALFETYDELRDPRLLVAAGRALGWLDRALRAGAPLDGVETAYLPTEGNALGPIGGTGLALVAFARHAAVTKSDEHLPRMRAMGRFLVRQLAADGHFEPYFVGAPQPWSEVLYYHGEAMLGLARLYEIDRDPRWLEALVRAARHRIETPYAKPRDAGRDYWLALALSELWRETHDPAHAARAGVIAEASMREWDEDEATWERTRAWSDAPRASPTATMTEALATVASLARSMGADDARLLAHARRAVTFVLAAQYDEDATYASRAPALALGGVHGDPFANVVRIDDVQHAVMAELTLLRAMRAR
jgi:hypothetical protein